MEIGQLVTFVDPLGTGCPALITAVWNQTGGNPSLNVVYVSDDEQKHDQYGRQIERASSVPHETNQAAHGNFWR